MGPAQFEIGINTRRPAFLADRMVHGRVELGGTAFVESALAVAGELWGVSEGIEVTDLVVDEPVVVGRRADALRHGRRATRPFVGGRDRAGRRHGRTGLGPRRDRDGVARGPRRHRRARRHPCSPADRRGGESPAAELFETWRDNGLVLGPRAQVHRRDVVGPGLGRRCDWRCRSAPIASALYPPLLEVCALALVGGKEPRACAPSSAYGSCRTSSRCGACTTSPIRTTTRCGSSTPIASWLPRPAGSSFRDLALDTLPPRAEWVYDLDLARRSVTIRSRPACGRRSRRARGCSPARPAASTRWPAT